MRKRRDPGSANTGGWITTYADMMNNLLVLFMALYAMSIMDVQKFQALANSLNSAFTGSSIVAAVETPDTGAPESIPPEAVQSLSPSPDESPAQEDDFDHIYQIIQQKIEESGYADSIILEKAEDYIKFRFSDSVLFYPDSPEMRQSSFEILKYMGDILLGVDGYIRTIDIGGHTATVNGGQTESFFAWELSSERAIAVLEFFVNNCSLPQSKMTVSGYSHYQPVASNDNEEDRKQNRRVEVKITRIKK